MVTRDTHVSHQMLRSLCGCPPNKVDDKSEVVVQDFRNTVFVYASNKVLVRALVGTLVNALENTNVKAMAMNMVKPTPEMVKKSVLLKKGGRGAQYQDETCVVSLWRGDESFKHVQNAITRFCQTYAFVQGVDVAMTESVKATRKEAELWIGPLTSAAAPEPPPAPSDEASPSNEPPNMNEEAVEGEDANGTNDETPPVDSSPPVHDPNDVVLMRESSTADTLPMEEKHDENHDRDQNHSQPRDP